MARIRGFGVVALVLVGILAAGCSDDGDDRSDPARSSRPTTSTTSGPTTTPPDDAACTLVTQADAETVFGQAARRGESVGSPGDAVCTWEADGEGPNQTLRFQLHEGSDIATYSVSNAPVNITVQRSVGGRAFAFAYLADGGDADAKRAAVNELADSVITRAE